MAGPWPRQQPGQSQPTRHNPRCPRRIRLPALRSRRVLPAAYTEALPDEKAATAIAFTRRARAFLAAHGITGIERIVTDIQAWWCLRRLAWHGRPCENPGCRCPLATTALTATNVLNGPRLSAMCTHELNRNNGDHLNFAATYLFARRSLTWAPSGPAFASHRLAVVGLLGALSGTENAQVTA
jgi:hypothetical protein